MAKYGSSKYGSSTYRSTEEHPYAGVSGKIMWMVQVDWDRDGVFGSETEPQSIVRIKFSAGRKSRIRTDGKGQESPKQETFRIDVLDAEGRYDQFNTASPLYAFLGAMGVMFRVLAVSTTGAGAAETVFSGVLTGLNYDARTRRATLTGEGMARWLMNVPVWTECQPSLPGGAWDSYFVADGSTPFPVNYWKGRTEGTPLRECVALTLARCGYPFGGYYGASVVALAGEEPDYFYFDGSSAWSHLEELADGFAARLFVLRDGRLFAMDRLDVTGMHAGLAAPTRAQESFGIERVNAFETLRNTVRVNVRPHSVTPFKMPYLNTYYREAWSQAGPFAVLPGETVDLDVFYDAGAPSEGSFLSVNNGSGFAVLYEAWSAADRTGTLMSSSGTGEGEFTLLWETLDDGGVVPFGNNQQWTRVRFKNWSAVETAYFFDCKVMLIGIQETGSPGVRQAVDAASVALNGSRLLSINSRWVQSVSMADNIAQAYVDALSSREKASPATVLYQWSGETLFENLLTFDVGVHVNFGLAGGGTAIDNFGMNGRWLIVGRELEWMSPDGQDAWVRLTYERIGESPVLTMERSSTGVSATPGASITWAHQVDEHDNRLLVVGVTVRAYQSVSGITYGGVALTKAGSAQYGSGDNPRAELWYLAAPAVGTANVVVSLSGSDFAQAVAVSFYNARQDVPVGSVVTANGGVSPANITASAELGDLALDVVGYWGASAASADAGQSALGAASSDGSWRIGVSSKVGVGSLPMGWSLPSRSAHMAGLTEATFATDAVVDVAGNAYMTTIDNLSSHRVAASGWMVGGKVKVHSTSSAGQVKFKVFRWNGGSGLFDFVGESELFSFASGGGVFSFTFASPIAVLAGDVFGYATPAASGNQPKIPWKVEAGGAARFVYADVVSSNAFAASIAYAPCIEALTLSSVWAEVAATVRTINW